MMCSPLLDVLESVGEIPKGHISVFVARHDSGCLWMKGAGCKRGLVVIGAGMCQLCSNS